MDHRGITEQDIEKMMEGASNDPQKEATKEQTEEEKKLMQEWE